MHDAPGRVGRLLGKGSAKDVLFTTAFAGGAGYAITLAAGAVLGNPGYLAFASFWSAIYLVVGALAGIQHETTRASTPAPYPTRPVTSARTLVVLTASAAVVALAASSAFWVPRVFDDRAWALLPPILVGAAGYVAIAVVSGVLAGLSSWRLVAIVISADALVRAALVGVALSVTRDIVTLAWCVALPFGVVGIASVLLLARAAQGRYMIAERWQQLGWNIARTVASGAAMGVLITGFPAILAATSSASDSEDVTALVFVSNLTRSPLIILAMAFQVMLVQRLRDSQSVRRDVTRILAALTGAAALAAIVVAAAGPWALRTFFADEYALSRPTLALLVASAAPAGALFITGAALLARGRHGAYVAGWGVAAAVALVALIAPAPLMVSVIGAVVVAPLVGLAVHYFVGRRAPEGAAAAQDQL